MVISTLLQRPRSRATIILGLPIVWVSSISTMLRQHSSIWAATATSADLPMSADEAVDKIRKRAGMPDFPTSLSNDEWWSKYQNERMVELAFEGHRFWDVRRWKEADKFFKNIQEMKITRNDDGSFTYTRETVQRYWDDKMYLFPIPNDVMLKHEKYGQKWEQNPGW